MTLNSRARLTVLTHNGKCEDVLACVQALACEHVFKSLVLSVSAQFLTSVVLLICSYFTINAGFYVSPCTAGGKRPL